MKVYMMITDETIKTDCMEAIGNLESNGDVSFPSEQSKSEFATELIDCIIDKAENYIYDNSYLINLTKGWFYEKEAYDLAEQYGYVAG